MNVDQAAEHKAKRERLLKVTISAFIILQFTLTIAHLSQGDAALRQAIVDSTGGLWKLSGLWQGWELFGPKIRNVNSHSVAIVSFDDGSITTWSMPRFEQFSMWEKFRNDKFRKWNGDNAQWPRYKEQWPAFARYVARLHYDGTGPKPVTFQLMLFQTGVPTPDSHIKRDELPKHDKPFCSFFYRYREGDFAK